MATKCHTVTILLITVAACASSPDPGATSSAVRSDSRLVGTWELVSTRISRNDTTVIHGTAPEFRSLKILNDTHYSVVTRRGEQFLRAGTGRYTLSGDTYTETVDLASTPVFSPGAVFTFRIQISGDTWTLDGGSGVMQVQEVWRRVR